MMALRPALAAPSSAPVPGDPCIVLLDHDTDWGRTFRRRLMSWGVEVVLGAHAPQHGAEPMLVMRAGAYGSDRMRGRVRQARALLPQAPLVLVTAAQDGLPPGPVSTEDNDSLIAILQSVGIGFIRETDICGGRHDLND
jgi:hypothetical protein